MGSSPWRGQVRASAARRPRVCRPTGSARSARRGNRSNAQRSTCRLPDPLWVMTQRFSRTVRFGKTPRPSGMRQRPRRANEDVDPTRTFSPAKRTSPSLGPDDACCQREEGRFSGTVRPEDSGHHAFLERRVDPVDHLDFLVGGPHSPELQEWFRHPPQPPVLCRDTRPGHWGRRGLRPACRCR